MDRAQERFELVALAGGLHSLRSLTNSQTFHPVVGPAAEAETIHVAGTRLIERARANARGVGGGEESDFVVWDVGLGAAANALAAIEALCRAAGGSRGVSARIDPAARTGVTPERPDGTAPVGNVRLLSFDRSLGALDFAIAHADALSYSARQRAWMEALRGGETPVSIPLGGDGTGAAGSGSRASEEAARGGPPAAEGASSPRVAWSVHTGDFPALLRGPEPLPAPHAVFFDPYSPAVNPDMWTLELFTDLHARLRPETPCLLTTYTRSTAVRVTLLLAGFYVGVGRSVGEKDETTVATNVPALLERPLDRRWVENKAYVSTNAAPLRASAGSTGAAAGPAAREPAGAPGVPALSGGGVVYSRNPISNEDFARLRAHAQFAG